MSNSGWLIERTSMWGAEWFCAGSTRWTRDSEKAIRFPDKETADEIWNALRISCNRSKVSFPYEEDGADDWDYHYDITDHLWVNEPAQLLEEMERLTQELARRLKEAEAREAVLVEALKFYSEQINGPVAKEALSLASPRAKQILAVMEAAFQWECTTWKDDISDAEDKLRKEISALK